MFDIGFWELALIGILALVVLGPKRLPEAARTAGQWVGKLRSFIANVKQDIDREIDSGELADLRRLRDELGQARNMIEETSNTIQQQASNIAQEVKSRKLSSRSGKKKLPVKKKAVTRKKAANKKTRKKSTAKNNSRKRKL